MPSGLTNVDVMLALLAFATVLMGVGVVILAIRLRRLEHHLIGHVNTLIAHERRQGYGHNSRRSD